MGCSQYAKCSDPKDSFGKPTNLSSSNGNGTDDGAFSALPDPDYSCNELESKTHLTKMIWDFGLACFTPSCLSNEQLEEKNSTQVQNDVNMEHNKAWLLAETGGCAGDQTNGDPNSVHSSFRFSLCSQVELDSLKVNCSTSTTILMVNLDNNLPNSRSKEVKWGRFDSLERTISPVASSLVRFSYGEILSATRNFSEGRVLGRGALSYVYRGRVGFLRTVVAIKRLDKEDKESSKAFCRELMIANSLEHPNVVPLLGFCIDPDGGLFLVYKYVSSGSLEHHLCGTNSCLSLVSSSKIWNLQRIYLT